MADDLNHPAPTSGGGGNEEVTEPVSRVRTAFGFLVDWDQTMTSRLAVCSSPTASWGTARPIMILLEHSGHAVPWIGGVSIAIATARSDHLRLTLFNLLYLLVFDIAVLLLCKALFQRSRPLQNLGDQTTVLSDRYSFPSGHATRAVAATVFIICQIDCSMVQIHLLVQWSACCCVSRVLLARHHVLDVIAGMLIGGLEYMVFMSCLSIAPDSKAGKYLKM